MRWDPKTKTEIDDMVVLSANDVHKALKEVVGNVPTEIEWYPDGTFKIKKPELSYFEKNALKVILRELNG
jgi:hypothetical protein